MRSTQKDKIHGFGLFQQELMPKYPDAAGFTFNVSFFMLDWGPSAKGDLYLTKYVQRTKPLHEAYKSIHIPNRIQEAGTHIFYAKHPYKR